MVFCCAKKDNSHTNKTDIDSSSYLAVAYVSDYYVILYNNVFKNTLLISSWLAKCPFIGIGHTASEDFAGPT